MSQYAPNDVLSQLVGDRLRALEIAAGEPLRLVFSKPGRSTDRVLSSRVWPSIERSGGTWRDGDTGYTDLLRQLIGAEVTGTREQSRKGLRIDLTRGHLIISPRRADPSREIALLSGFEDGRWMAWWPGDYAFEDLV
ncbi:hypothetical protein FEZ32_01055 [Acidipropionibacterium jensenii]|uniref:hypothetical protein n=1 Tax=Acidipropionibacterium jensenii TaxID=1749 RepID=UPI00110BC1B5|nr:hypothetical protein [Acidipropionibacterium jensenii]QCV87138.1 hypothetical protein FEZ32_01055 [Acidipropionibacterium jensenii]